MAESERLFLPRVADLYHVRDVAHKLRLLFLAVLFEKVFKKRRGIEVIFDGTFASAGYDNDVLDARRHALFRHILNLWLIDNGEHFFRLRFCRRQKARTET